MKLLITPPLALQKGVATSTSRTRRLSTLISQAVTASLIGIRIDANH